MVKLDIERLLNAVENDKMENIIDYNLSDIKQIKNNVLQQLNLSREKLKLLNQKLKNYRFIDGIDSLESGYYYRWIKLNNPKDIKLTLGAYLCDIDINPDGVHLKFITHTKQHWQVRMNEIFLFQRLTDDENVILSALKYLNK